MGHLGSRWHGKDIKNSQFAIRGATGRKNTAIESKMSQHPFKINEEPGKAEDKSDDQSGETMSQHPYKIKELEKAEDKSRRNFLQPY